MLLWRIARDFLQAIATIFSQVGADANSSVCNMVVMVYCGHMYVFCNRKEAVMCGVVVWHGDKLEWIFPQITKCGFNYFREFQLQPCVIFSPRPCAPPHNHGETTHRQSVQTSPTPHRTKAPPSKRPHHRPVGSLSSRIKDCRCLMRPSRRQQHLPC